MREATLIATLRTPPSPGGEELSALSPAVGWLEVRADLAGELEPDWLRARFRGRLLYALRSRFEGGDFDGPPAERVERLRRAARSFDLVELEGARDLAADLLEAVSADRRLVAWHGPAAGLSELGDTFAQLSSVPACLYKLAAKATAPGEELAPLSLLRSLGRADTVAYADGPAGFWTRLVAARLGAPLVYGSVPGTSSADPAEPSVKRLVEDYGLPRLAPVEWTCGIVGSQVFQSLSPRLHNAAYRALDLPGLFLPFRADSFDEFWRGVVTRGALDSLGMPLRGLVVTSPHKEAAVSAAGGASPTARRAESANVLVRGGDGVWRAETTDPEVLLTAERERGVVLRGGRAAVVGCGGAGRALAAALDERGSEVVLVNRGEARGRYASRLLGLPYVPAEGFSAEGFDVVVNATSVGRDDGRVPFDAATLDEGALLIDMVYGSAPTPLAARARSLGRAVIDGREVLLAQARAQFQLMTGAQMPRALARERLGFEPEPADLAAAR